MSVDGPDQLLRTVLPPALEVLTAWSIADNEADPSIFRHAMNRVFVEAADAPDPRRGLAQMMFGCPRCPASCSTSSPGSPANPAARCCAMCTCATSTRPETTALIPSESLPPDTVSPRVDCARKRLGEVFLQLCADNPLIG
jgi:hypothetical protein